jgi:hypothetical protein
MLKKLWDAIFGKKPEPPKKPPALELLAQWPPNSGDPFEGNEEMLEIIWDAAKRGKIVYGERDDNGNWNITEHDATGEPGEFRSN